MKILFVADIVPELSSGSAVRNYYLLKALAKKHEVDFVGMTDDKKQVQTNVYKELSVNSYILLERRKLDYMHTLVCLTYKTFPYIQLRRNIYLPRHIEEILSQYEVMHLAELNSFFMMEKYLKKVKAKVVLDAHNIEYFRLSSELKQKDLLSKVVGNFLSSELKKQEINAVKQTDRLLTCSSVDADCFATYTSKKNISVIPNGVNISYYSAKIDVKKTKKMIILFMGLLSYFPNEEGLRYYFSEIYPTIKRSFPETEFHIIGKDAPQWLIELSKRYQGLKVFGFVKDTRPYIANATVCIAPLLSGSGTRLKILEYMAMSKPIVATEKAAEGIIVENGKNIFLAKNSEEFIKSISILLQNTSAAKKLGENASKLVKNNYDWEMIGKQLNTIYQQVAL